MKVLCPLCKREVVWSEESPFRPFCSERCKTNDLSAWATETYKIEETISPDDVDAIEAIEAAEKEKNQDIE